MMDDNIPIGSLKKYPGSCETSPTGSTVCGPPTNIPLTYKLCNGDTLSTHHFFELYEIIGSSCTETDSLYFCLPNIPVDKDGLYTIIKVNNDITDSYDTLIGSYKLIENVNKIPETYKLCNGGPLLVFQYKYLQQEIGDMCKTRHSMTTFCLPNIPVTSDGFYTIIKATYAPVIDYPIVDDVTIISFFKSKYNSTIILDDDYAQIYYTLNDVSKNTTGGGPATTSSDIESAGLISFYTAKNGMFSQQILDNYMNTYGYLPSDQINIFKILYGDNLTLYNNVLLNEYITKYG